MITILMNFCFTMYFDQWRTECSRFIIIIIKSLLNYCSDKGVELCIDEKLPYPVTDVIILKIFLPKNSAKKIGVFDSKQS
jgi:hypothetical protein